MKKIDAGYAVVLAICVLAVWPFLSRGGLPQATDAELHVFRLAELSRLVRGGELYPRWAPNFYFGYGYPIFNYYAPLAYYLGLPFELLPRVDAVAAVKVIFVLAPVAGALGVYGFVRDHWSRSAAYVASAAFVYAPYVQYVDPHARGDLAEVLSLGLFPLALWALSRLHRKPGPGTWLVAVLLIAAVILAHNLMAMVFFAMLSAWAIWQLGLHLRARAGGAILPGELLWLFGALGLGVAVAAFFWLPVALEQEAVNLTSLIGDGSHFDFRNHFLTVRELLGPTAWLDWGATEPAFRLNLGLAQWILAALGVIALLTGTARQRAQAAYFALGAALLILMMLRASQPIWEVVPLLPYMQFPWRLLGAVAAILAVLGGVGVDALLNLRIANETARNKVRQTTGGAGGAVRLVGQFWASRWVPAVFVAFIIILALPLTLVPPWLETPWDTSARGVANIERQGRWLGTTSTADFVPQTVDVIPRPEEGILADFEAGRPLDRVNRAALPDGVQVETERLRPLHTRYQVSSPDDFLLRLFLFDFPGWEARVDGQPVETELGRPEGFLVVPVPAGEHVVELAFTETPVRRLSWLLSAAGLLLSLGLAVVLWRGAPLQRSPPAQPVRPKPGTSAPVLFVAGLLLIVGILLEPMGMLHHRSTGDVAIPAQHDVYVDFGGQIALIGFDAPQAARPGQRAPVTLYWKGQQALDVNFQVFLHLQAPDGTIVAQSDKLNPGDFPTRRWPSDRYVRDAHTLHLGDDLQPGAYALSTGVWMQDEGWRLPLLNEQGVQIGDHYVIQTLEVVER
ncbi:MAG TPA: DUF6541 family protein [Candidatus Sulfomarinibacteraceae bacterium]|nr:DUF6541 family protein [Candidatus Sulfomarinibacteraceae bacterium]